MEPFEFIVDGPPVSLQIRWREKLRAWKSKVRGEAEKRWPSGQQATSTHVRVTITHFYKARSLDVDNIPKPIADALQGLVYVDDDQITDSYCRKRILREDLVVVSTSALLAQRLSRDEEFLHILVEDAPDQGVID
ncbi:MAG TPA: RusA family crossover junction endodeoxyribonuclease [Thermoanaerobaculia bacterium]|nr:RusA family crossover junction endodeoxyribonuclease [Thermoanaerobaculia bacterium]